MRVAAIDCGTNSLRLLVAEPGAGGRLTDVIRRMEVVRLGAGVDRTGELAPDALDRTLRVLREYAAELRTLGAERVRMVATSATRDATNRGVFVGGVREVLGIEPEVLSGEQEAALTYAGAASDLLARGGAEAPVLVVDVGGGSTELVLGAADLAEPPVASRSLDVGCVRLTERHLGPADGGQYAAALVDAVVADVDRALDTIPGALDLTAARTVVAVAGTATTVAALAHGLPEYDADRIHLSQVTAAEVERVVGLLLGSTAEQRAAMGPMHAGRVDVITAGALVLRQVLRRSGPRPVGTGAMLASERDILDGVAASLLDP